MIPPQPFEPMKTWDYTSVVALQQHIEATVHIRLQGHPPTKTKILAAHWALLASLRKQITLKKSTVSNLFAA